MKFTEDCSVTLVLCREGLVSWKIGFEERSVVLVFYQKVLAVAFIASCFRPHFGLTDIFIILS